MCRCIYTYIHVLLNCLKVTEVHITFLGISFIVFHKHQLLLTVSYLQDSESSMEEKKDKNDDPVVDLFPDDDAEDRAGKEPFFNPSPIPFSSFPICNFSLAHFCLSKNTLLNSFCHQVPLMCIPATSS